MCLRSLYGKIRGFTKTMKFNRKRHNFGYRSAVLKRTFGRISFHRGEIHKYSAKIASFIPPPVEKSEGIILIYSQYLDSGCIPSGTCSRRNGDYTIWHENHSSKQLPMYPYLMIPLKHPIKKPHLYLPNMQ